MVLVGPEDIYKKLKLLIFESWQLWKCSFQ